MGALIGSHVDWDLVSVLSLHLWNWVNHFATLALISSCK